MLPRCCGRMATADSVVTAFALRSAVQDSLPDSQSYLKYIEPKGVLQAANVLGLETTIFEVIDDGIRATWSTLPNRQLDAQALILFGAVSGPFNNATKSLLANPLAQKWCKRM